MGANRELLEEWCKCPKIMKENWKTICSRIEDTRWKELDRQVRKEAAAKWKGVLVNDSKKGAGLQYKIIKGVKQATYIEGQAEERDNTYLGCSVMERLQRQEGLWGGLWQSQEARRATTNERK